MKKTIYRNHSYQLLRQNQPRHNSSCASGNNAGWWDKALKRYDTFVSEIVIEEAMASDPEAAKKRLGILKRFSHLDLNPTVEKMAQVYVKKLKIAPRALRDAVHLAVASVHSVDYLLTWNCSHIANGEVIRKLMQINMSHGIKTPVICTPEELMPKTKGG